jgi:membrane-associated phospholipid phosphatase
VTDALPVNSGPPTPGPTTPGADHLGEWVARFDERADALLERLRGRPLPDLVFRTASAVGDFSTLWHLTGGLRTLTDSSRRQQALALSGLLAAESLLVNQGVKRLFHRQRPTETGDHGLEVRRPSTSSFPSGHASSAFFAATILATWDRPRKAPLWFGVAAVVATSRAYVRIHHASDVVGGAVLGLGLGLIARPLVRRLR